MHLKRVAFQVLRQNQDDALGFFPVERFRTPLFHGLIRRIHRTPRPKVFVALPHVAIRQVRLLFEHAVDEFVKVVHVFRKRFATGHVRHVQRQFLEILFQVDAAILTRQNVDQVEHEITIMRFLLGGGFYRVVETHGVEDVPQARAPHRRQHPFAAAQFRFFERSFSHTLDFYFF